MTLHRRVAHLFALVLVGCAGNPPVQPAAGSKSPFEGAVYGGETVQLERPSPGAEVYRAFYQGGSGFVSLSSVREAVEEMATKHCIPVKERARGRCRKRPQDPHMSWVTFLVWNGCLNA